MKKKQDINEIVGDTTHDLAEKGRDALHLAGDRARDLGDYLAPRVQELAENIAEYLEPRAKDLSKKTAKFASETREDLQPKLARFASDTKQTLQPRLDDAYSRVQPFVEPARDRFERDVLPRLNEAYDSVASKPATKEARKRMAAAAAALAGELSLPEPKKKKSAGKTVLQVIMASGLLAGVVYAVKRFLAPEESGWQAHEPSTAYRPAEKLVDTDTTTLASTTTTGSVSTTTTTWVATTTTTAPSASAPLAPLRSPGATAVTDGDSTLPEGADPFLVSPYGEGSYVGAEPPAEYRIKGNERSMKYHVEGAGGYDRTIADVWFRSEEAAEAAGFTRAQR